MNYKHLISILLCLCGLAYGARAQQSANDIKNAVQKQILHSDYTEAINTLENNLSVVSADTSLLDLLAGMYMQAQAWDKIVHLFTKEALVNKGSSVLRLAKFYSKFPQQRTELSEAGIRIPFDKDKHGAPILKVRINDRVFELLFDTGAGITTLSSSTAKKCNVRYNAANTTTAGTFSGNAVSVVPGMIDSMNIEGLNVYNHPCMVIDKQAMQYSVMGIRIYKIDGIIGWNFIQQFDVVLDNKTGIIDLKPAGSVSSRKPINFIWNKNPIVGGHDAAGHAVCLVFDTGSEIAGVYDTYINKIGINRLRSKDLILGEIDGPKKIKSYTLPDVAFLIDSSLTVLGEVQVLPNTSAFINCDGIIGHRQFSDNKIHFNMPAGIFEILE